MTEQEILCRAKEYIDKLANGIDPLTDTPVSENDIVNHIRIARCLFYVSDVLGRVIANGFLSKTRRPPKQPFSITEDALAKLEYSDAPIPLSHFLQRLNTLINQDAMQKLSYPLSAHGSFARRLGRGERAVRKIKILPHGIGDADRDRDRRADEPLSYYLLCHLL